MSGDDTTGASAECYTSSVLITVSCLHICRGELIFEMSKQTSTCPICDGRAKPYCTKRAFDREWHIDRCSSCGHGFVRNRPSMAELERCYASKRTMQPRQPLTKEALDAMPACAELASRIAALTPERGATLDVGCGSGGFSYHLHRKGFSPNVLNDLDETGRAALGFIPDGEFHLGPFEDLVDPGPFSAIVMSQVLEHTLDPQTWLEKSRSLLSAAGVLAIALPNFGGVYRLLGSRDPMLIPPFHLNYFTPRSLEIALRGAGLESLAMESRSKVRLSSHSTRKARLARQAIVSCWNIVSTALDRTRRGVILHAFARPR